MNSDGNLVVIDFKTGKNVYDQHALQLSAYCKALEELCECKHPISHAYILHFNKEKAEFDFLKVDDVNYCFSLFLDCLHLCQLNKNACYSHSLFHKEEK